MRAQSLIAIVLCILCLNSVLLALIPNCSAQQQPNLSVTYTVNGLDMAGQNTVETDTEKGLLFTFYIANTGSQPLSIDQLDISLSIQSKVPYQGQLQTIFSKDITFSSLYLLKGTPTTNSVNITATNSNYWVSWSNPNLAIGSYTAEVTYTIGQSYSYSSSQSIKVSPYGLTINVVDPHVSTSPNQGNTNLNFLSQLFDLSLAQQILSGVIVLAIGAVATALLYRRRRRR
jgi:hypothetical protein